MPGLLLQIVTLRTMHHILTAVLARVHHASVRLRITPEMEQGAAEGGNGPAERVDGSTARTVAAVAVAFSEELLAAVTALGGLQQHLDCQEEGCVLAAQHSVSQHSNDLHHCPPTLPKL